jgi:hypothetical protein
MAKGNAGIAVLFVTGGLCVPAGVVKHVSTPPSKLSSVFASKHRGMADECGTHWSAQRFLSGNLKIAV